MMSATIDVEAPSLEEAIATEKSEGSLPSGGTYVDSSFQVDRESEGSCPTHGMVWYADGECTMCGSAGELAKEIADLGELV